MIVRIVNNKRDRDSFFDCRNSCLHKETHDGLEEYLLILEFVPGGNIEVILSPGDEIYYMNDGGNTIHADYAMRNK